MRVEIILFPFSERNSLTMKWLTFIVEISCVNFQMVSLDFLISIWEWGKYQLPRALKLIFSANRFSTDRSMYILFSRCGWFVPILLKLHGGCVVWNLPSVDRWTLSCPLHLTHVPICSSLFTQSLKLLLHPPFLSPPPPTTHVIRQLQEL